MFEYFSLKDIYDKLYHSLDRADYEKDLEWWAKNYGADMPIHAPQFVVCVLELKVQSAIFIIV